MTRLLFILLISLVTLSCNNENEGKTAQKAPGRKELADLNRYMVQKDRERIENYIVRKELRMTETRSGLWYQIRSEGSGAYLKTNDRVMLEYECSLLDGTRMYSSKENGLKEVVVGRTRIESGLDQGLRFLKPGGEAIFIIPPFLAWGIPGDGNKIPSRSVVVYEVKVLPSMAR